MRTYSITLTDGSKITVLNKIAGRKRSIRLPFFKIRRKKVLIAYSVHVEAPQPTKYTIYKIKNSGAWKRGAEIGASGQVSSELKKRTKEIKSAIDNYESSISAIAYRALF